MVNVGSGVREGVTVDVCVLEGVSVAVGIGVRVEVGRALAVGTRV